MKTKLMILILILSISLHAVSKSGIIFLNIGGNAVGSLIKGAVIGKVRNFHDISKMLLWGGAAGMGFYEAKNIIGKGHVFPGLLLANISASVTDNVATGNNPLSQIGYTLGPVRINFSSRFRINFDVSAKNIIELIATSGIATGGGFRDGLFYFTTQNKDGNTLGWCHGVYPIMLHGTNGRVYHHEVIHAVQNLQLMALSPEPFSKKRKSFFTGLRFEVTNFCVDYLMSKTSYDHNFKEIEVNFFNKK